MSSMRNSIQRRSHRERGQLQEREKLGHLEKHKDYALRAKDHKKKQTVLKSLKQKAADRNEDEFYFGMVSRGKFAADRLAGGGNDRRWTGTVAGDRGNRAMDVDTVRLLKTQDIGYLRTMRNVVAKEVATLEQQAVVSGALSGVEVKDDDEEEEDSEDEDDEVPSRRQKSTPKTKKIVFADSAEERVRKVPAPNDDDDTDTDGDDDAKGSKIDRETRNRKRNALRLQKKLQMARRKLKALTNAEQGLELQRARMAKTATVGGVTKGGKQIKVRERKR